VVEFYILEDYLLVYLADNFCPFFYFFKIEGSADIVFRADIDCAEESGTTEIFKMGFEESYFGVE